jgi:hypothetical protein
MGGFLLAVFFVGQLPTNNSTARQSQKKRMSKRNRARNSRTSNDSEEEVLEDEAAGQAWLPVILPSDSKSWGKSSRSFAEISQSLEPPGGDKKLKRRKTASYGGGAAPMRVSKSERQRKQG